MEVLLTGSEFAPFHGKVVSVTLDESGDARLPDHVREHTNRTFALVGEFEPLTEEQAAAFRRAGYQLVIPVEDMMALHMVLDSLPENLVESAVLNKN